jgi:hypothetical protein
MGRWSRSAVPKWSVTVDDVTFGLIGESIDVDVWAAKDCASCCGMNLAYPRYGCFGMGLSARSFFERVLPEGSSRGFFPGGSFLFGRPAAAL